jgi:hypothetical protein
MACNLYPYHAKERIKMDKAKARVLVSILKDSSLYVTMSHEEKISLLSRLAEDYPSIFDEYGDDEKAKDPVIGNPSEAC